MKAQELRNLKDEELKERLLEFYQELFNLRFQKVSGRLANTARPRQVRRDIARIKTILRERQIALELEEEVVAG
ncbi:MAG: 50S ribosomal protein L29 [Chloroflexaceae bacterium]|nr:50S ribosomal protein L29 [Chloroflexaceae bacterium]NJL33951.1 50S ribosomal protein L29 [Chloroflexaceae bacterium]